MAVASYPEYTGEGNTGSKRVTKVKEMIDECEKLSLEAPSGELRAYASAIDEDRDFALPAGSVICESTSCFGC